MKQFKGFGVANKWYNNAQEAAGDTYTTNDGNLTPTPLVFNDNPFNEQVKNAKNIFEIGFGVGRNVKWIMENTNANYYGVEPNPTMFDNFWEFNDEKYKDRIFIYQHLSELSGVKIDVVLSTFVFQHIGFRPDENTMNITDITNYIRHFTVSGTIWLLLEHDSEEHWIERWFKEHNITPDVYIRNYKGIPEMTHRDHTTKDGHHLIIWKEK